MSPGNWPLNASGRSAPIRAGRCHVLRSNLVPRAGVERQARPVRIDASRCVLPRRGARIGKAVTGVLPVSAVRGVLQNPFAKNSRCRDPRIRDRDLRRAAQDRVSPALGERRMPRQARRVTPQWSRAGSRVRTPALHLVRRDIFRRCSGSYRPQCIRGSEYLQAIWSLRIQWRKWFAGWPRPAMKARSAVPARSSPDN